MKLWTLSKTDLARQCLYWLSPHVPRQPWQPKGEAAMLGDAVHLIGQRVLEGHANPTEGVSEEAAKYETGLRQMLAALPDGERIAELPMAWDCETKTARVLPSKGQRDYTAKRWTELVGTADIIIIGDDWVGCYDIKTGIGARSKEAKTAGQLLTLGLCIARIRKVERVKIGFCHVEVGDWYVDEDELDCFDLLDVEDELDKLYREVLTGQMVPKPGHHCYSAWCPAASVCPATQATLARIDDEAHRHLPMVPTIESPEQAARVRIGLKLIEEKRKAWQEALEQYVLHQGAVEVSPGVWFGAVEKSSERVSISYQDLGLLVEHMGEDAARDAVEVRTSKTAIESALKARQAKRGEGIAKARALYDELRPRGLMRASTYTTFSEFSKNSKNDNEDGEAA